MKLVTSATAANLADPRKPNPFVVLKKMRFPTTREIQSSFLEIQPDTTEELNILDTLFPESNTLATSVEMYVTRQDSNGYVGMTFPHNLESEVRTFDRGAKIDIAKMEWNPMHFKDSKAWGERQMVEMGKLLEEVSTPQINEEIGEFLAVMKRRIRNRKQWMKHQVLKTGKITIDGASVDNPDKLKYSVDYGVTNLVLDMPVKIDDKSVDGVSLLDPVKWITDINRAGKFTNRKIVAMVVNSNFVDYLADNTFIRATIDYDMGLQTTQAVATPRYVYAERALDVFKRFTKIQVIFNDQVYEDKQGQQHYYFEDGQALLLYGSVGPLGEFVNTAHVDFTYSGNGVAISTGEYAYAVNKLKEVKPSYEIISGFSGMPMLKGYDPIDFTYERFKWVTFASHEIQNPALPKRPDIGAPL
ncbi:hypothetical protein Dxin01_00186 [Deinococcus xinjiangensis]|uniref:Major capsid protein n=1 Tax=Deinococcus xinjiangensis TaxID=457454 RepID=A0ABP9V8G4_9DEIO